MVSERIKQLRKKIQGGTERVREKKQLAKERRETAKERLRQQKRKVTESGPVKEARETKRELGQLKSDVKDFGSEIGGGITGATESARGVAERVSDAADKIPEVDDMGMAGEDLGTDLEIVDDLQSGEAMQGMGSVGFETSFEGRQQEELRELTQKGREQGLSAAETAFKNRVKRRAKRQRLQELESAAEKNDVSEFDVGNVDKDTSLDSIDDDILGEFE